MLQLALLMMGKLGLVEQVVEQRSRSPLSHLVTSKY
jgi:hypothetical protein